MSASIRTIFLAILIAALARPVHAQMIGSDPVVQPFCALYKDPALKPAADAMCEGRLLHTFARSANEVVTFAKMLPIVAVECGQPSAFYDRTKGAIFVCYELAREVLERLAREAAPAGSARPQVVAGALLFVFAHEVGHAAINLHRLPVAGSEEDAADRIGALLLTHMADRNTETARDWASGAHWLFGNRRRLYAPGHFIAEASPDPQRQLDLACWIYGSNPDRYSALAPYARLPDSRVRGCPEEFRQMANAARQMLASHLKR